MLTDGQLAPGQASHGDITHDPTKNAFKLFNRRIPRTKGMVGLAFIIGMGAIAAYTMRPKKVEPTDSTEKIMKVMK